ncbi:lipopolysaccharide biosynthesis protein [Bacillus thuringiensis]|nr:oligosaccharide flippase family protein [Bacillus thuringiensis]
MKNSILSNHFIKSFFILATGTAMSHIVILLATPILTRLYSPEEFGLFSMYLSIMYSVSVVASLMYDQAIPLPTDDQEGWDTLVLSLIIAIFMSFLVFVMVWLLPIEKWMISPQLGQYAWLLALSVLGIGWFQAFNSWSVRMEEYPSISKSKISMNSGQIVSQVALGFLNIGILGLLVGELFGRISGCLTYIKMISKNTKSLRIFNLKGLINSCIRYKKFPLLSSWSAFINVSCSYIPIIFLAVHYGPTVAGWYLLAEKILIIPEALIGYSIKQVYMSQSSKFSTKAKEFTALFWLTVKQMVVISGIVMGGISLITPYIIPVLFGEVWTESGVYLQMISILYVMKMVVNPISWNFYVLESQMFQMISEIIRFSLICVSLIVSYFYMDNPKSAIFCISFLASVGYLTHGYFSWYVMKVHFQNEEKRSGMVNASP